jgi:hypothetical protein
MKILFRHSRCNYRLLIIILCSVSMLILASCKKSPTNPAPVAQSLAGIYVGIGQLGGGATNIRVEFAQDSLERWIGGIRYRGAVTYFETVQLDSTEDTVHFAYHRSDVSYQAWALISGSGLAFHFTTPANVPEFSLNREQDGTNLSGAWSGWMYSQFVGTIHSAVMTMDQRDQLFYGTLTTVLWETAQFQFNTGVSNASSFQLSGTARIGTSDTPCLLYGNYLTVDSVAGNWQLGQNGSVDQGSFAFGRYFN